MPSPSVVLCSRKPDHEERAEGDLTGGVGRTDGEPFAQVVEPDPEGNERGDPQR